MENEEWKVAEDSKGMVELAGAAKKVFSYYQFGS